MSKKLLIVLLLAVSILITPGCSDGGSDDDSSSGSDSEDTKIEITPNQGEIHLEKGSSLAVPVAVKITANKTLAFSAKTDSEFVYCSPTEGEVESNGTFTFYIHASKISQNLNEGSYDNKVVIETGNTTKTILIKLIVSNTDPVIGPETPEDSEFAGNEGGPFIPSSHSYEITTNKSVGIEAKTNQLWLDLRLSNTMTHPTNPATLTLSLNDVANNLEPKVYSAQVEITNQKTGQTILINVELTVTPVPPKVLKVAQNSGPLTGDRTMYLEVENLKENFDVLLNGKVPSFFTLFENTLTILVPKEEQEGAKHLVITNPDGGTVTIEEGFVYETFVTPSSTVPQGGTRIKLYGSKVNSIQKVTFDETVLADFQVESSLEATVKLPHTSNSTGKTAKIRGYDAQNNIVFENEFKLVPNQELSSNDSGYPEKLAKIAETKDYVWVAYQINKTQTNGDIRLEKYSRTLEKIASLELCSHPANQQVPEIIALDDGNILVIWLDERKHPSQGRPEIYGMLVSSDGTLLWEQNGKALVQGDYYRMEPKVAAISGTEDFYLAWIYGEDIGEWGLKISRFNSNGQEVWNETLKNNSTGRVAELQLVTNSSGQAFCGWQDSSSGSFTTYAAKILADKSTPWKQNGVAVTNQTSLEFDMGAGEDGCLYITFSSSKRDIYLQRVSSTGHLSYTNEGLVVHQEKGRHWKPRIAVPIEKLPNVFVSWYSDLTGEGEQINCQRVENGRLAWQSHKTLTRTAANSRIHRTVSDDKFLIAFWTDKKNGASHVFAQKIDINGNNLWLASGVAVTTGFGNVVLPPQPLLDGCGGFYVVWEDYQSTNLPKIFSARIYQEGSHDPDPVSKVYDLARTLKFKKTWTVQRGGETIETTQLQHGDLPLKYDGSEYYPKSSQFEVWQCKTFTRIILAECGLGIVPGYDYANEKLEMIRAGFVLQEPRLPHTAIALGYLEENSQIYVLECNGLGKRTVRIRKRNVTGFQGYRPQ